MDHIKSWMISNALVSEEDARSIAPPHVTVQPGQVCLVPVLRVKYKQKWLFCCLCGGHMDGDNIHTTPVGKVTYEMAKRFTTPEATLIVRQINCEGVGFRAMADKLKKVFESAPPGCLVLFLGDMTGVCDGRIYPHLNLQKEMVSVQLKR